MGGELIMTPATQFCTKQLTMTTKDLGREPVKTRYYYKKPYDGF
jgi:hypothetical protein